MVLFSLGYPFMPAFSTLLSILYWFYFLYADFINESLEVKLSILYWFYFLVSVITDKGEETYLSILYWFYFLDFHQKWQTFSSWLSILYWFYFLEIKELGPNGYCRLSILYWFYFLIFRYPFFRFFHYDFQSYIGSIFSIRCEKTIGICIKLSILYWFYFLRECPVLQVNAGRTFNPILVLFSRLRGSCIFRNIILSILYWFYFLWGIHSCPHFRHCFQSYIGSIFSCAFSPVPIQGRSSFNPILVLFSLYPFIVDIPRPMPFQSYIGSIFSRNTVHFYSLCHISFNPILVLFSQFYIKIPKR